MTLNQQDYTLLSPPFNLRWLGWEANTLDLQRAGWQISMDQRPAPFSRDHHLHIALRYKSVPLIYGYGNVIIPYEDFYKSSYTKSDPLRRREVLCDMQLAQQITFHATDILGRRFDPIDATPTMLEARSIDLQQMCIFRSLPKDAPDIIIPEPAFPELLDKLLKMQAPKQQYIRDKMLKEELQQSLKPDVGAILRLAR